MGSHCRRTWLIALLLLFPLGCSGCRQDVEETSVDGTFNPAQKPVVRVRLLEGRRSVQFVASEPPTVRAANGAWQRLNVAAGQPVEVTLSSSGGWVLGNVPVPAGQLTVQPARDGTVTVDGKPYRGRYRLVPTRGGAFDVVNDVDIDAYLASVVSKELLWNWADEAYKAQAIVARTYALYEVKKDGPARGHWDVYPDERDQVYGGIAAESAKSRSAVDATRGVVVAHGPVGQERIFRTYFSSCCGGVTQSATDAFGPRDPNDDIPPLYDQNVKALCAASPHFNWGPIVVKKDELTRRFKLFGQRRGRPEKDMAGILRVEVAKANRFGRPVRFVVTDVRNQRYIFSGEELRWAVNTDAPSNSKLKSSFVKLINDPEAVRFVEGHGLGHGAGMCQWCAQTRADAGMRHEDIVLAAYQRARLVKAY